MWILVLIIILVISGFLLGFIMAILNILSEKYPFFLLQALSLVVTITLTICTIALLIFNVFIGIPFVFLMFTGYEKGRDLF